MSIADRIEVALLAPSPLALHILLGLVIFIETGVLFAFFIPGDSILFGAGLVAASRGDINIATLASVIFLSAFLGDQMGYYLGKKYGRGYFAASNPHLKDSSRMLAAFFVLLTLAIFIFTTGRRRFLEQR